MEQHEKTAKAHRILSSLYIVAGGLILVFAGFSAIASAHLPSWRLCLFWIFIFLAGMGLHRLIAAGAMRKRYWAWVASLCCGIFALPILFPVGTVIGIYLLRNLDWEEDAPAAAG